ncbi:MAG: arginyltransferase [Methylococcaceae bacterium]|jgi:arginine-tRNA-protein transferase
MISIPLVLSYEHECSYLEETTAQSMFVHPSFPINNAIYSALIQQGFRRSGDEVYRPHCTNCSACIPARIAVNDFNPSRNQNRCLKKNHQTLAVIKPPVFQADHYELYLRYQNHRHSFGDMANSSAEEYLNFLSSQWCDTQFVEFFIDGQLVCVAIVDQLDNALSAVYTFFDPAYSSYSPGVYAVLWQIEQAKKLQKEFLYLGFWIESCKKMAYKNQYQPLQLLIEQTWKTLLDNNIV